MALTIDLLANDTDRAWCARLLATNEPWITLRRDFASCYLALAHATKESYLVRDGKRRAGVLILDMQGPFPGYIQTICLAPEARRRGLGSQVIIWAEERIFRDSPNVFMLVSSFNPDAQRLYKRLGYETIGVLRSFIVEEYDELLLRKSRGPWETFRSAASS